MIPAFSLDRLNFLVGYGEYNGLVYFTHEIGDGSKNINTLRGNVIDCNESTIYELNAKFEIITGDHKLRIVGNDNDIPIDLTIISAVSSKEFQLQINGRYGDKEVNKRINLVLKNVNISGQLIIDDIVHQINLVFGSAILHNKFIVSGIDKIRTKMFSISVAPKLGINMKMKYQVDGLYGNKMLTSETITNGKILKQLLTNIQRIITS